MTTISFAADIYLRSNQEAIQYSADNTNYITLSSWPCRITNTSNYNKTIYITNNLIITTADMYFIIYSDNITIDGQNNTININSVTSYPGLVTNTGLYNNKSGLSTGYDNIKIKNLGVTSTSSTLQYGGGWIGQVYMNQYASNCEIINCYSTGDILIGAGGIFGSSSRGTATNCYSSGAIAGNGAGGIFGSGSQCTSINLYS